MADFKVELDDGVPISTATTPRPSGPPPSDWGSLFNAGDYPKTLVGLFDVELDFPSFEPPDYLVLLAPGLSEQERTGGGAIRRGRATGRAGVPGRVRPARRAPLRPDAGEAEDGQVFRDTAVEDLTEFFSPLGS